MTFKRKLTELETSIQTWIKTAAKTQQGTKNQQSDLEELLPLLQKAIKDEQKTLEIETSHQINSGYQSQLATEAIIDPKYKDIKDLQQFLGEDNIRDTNPIFILSFKKLIGLTIDYLQNLTGMLNVLAGHTHQKDRINNSIKGAILDLFTGNDVNSYALNEHIRTVIGKIIDDIFNNQSSVRLSDFCAGLAYGIQQQLIHPFQNTSKKKLKKAYGKKFRRHKKSPYPFVSKILTAIEIHDVPFDVQGDENKEKLIKNLALWYSDFLQELLKFEAEHQTDFLNNKLLQKGLKGFGASLANEVTPPYCKEHLSDNVISNLASKDILKVGDLIPNIKTELDALRLKVKASIEAGNFKGSDDVDYFLGIQAQDYFDFIRTALEENHFDEYKTIIKKWVISLDKLMNKLGIDQERGKYNYKSKLIALNLSKLFKIEHELIDFSDFTKEVITGIKASGFSLELSEIDTLFSDAIADGSIYTKLIGLYNTAIENGTFNTSLDTLETTLPTMSQIGHAILSAKINLILNREIKDLSFKYDFAWEDRTKIITKLIDTVLHEADIVRVYTNLITIIEDLTSKSGDENDDTTPPPIESDSWTEWAKGILKSIKELPEKLGDVIVQAARQLITGYLSNTAQAITMIRDFLETQLNSGGILNLPDALSNTLSEIYFPLSLSLDEDKNGNFLPYLTLKNGTTQTDVWSILKDENYYKLEATTLGLTVGNVNNYTVPSELKLKIRFTDPGYSISSDISAVFISAGVSSSKGEYDMDIELTFGFDSTYNKGSNLVEISNITFTNIRTITLGQGDVASGNLLNTGNSTSTLEKGNGTTIKAFI